MLNEALRQFWVKGINSITGTQSERFIDAVNSKSGYVFYTPIQQNVFTINLTDNDKFLRALACDINRFSCASIESVNDIYYKPSFPNSHSWKCIKCYYAAYYAGHSILRMFGISCTNFERLDLVNIEEIAELYGMKSTPITKGYYKCTFSSEEKTITCEKINAASNMGSHEQFWTVFLHTLNYLIEKLVGSSVHFQPVIMKLCELKDNLTVFGSNGGNWLSRVRNDINYKHLDGMWFPYREIEKYFEDIKRIIKTWQNDPMTIDISMYSGRYYLRFISTCIFLISLNKLLSVEMAARCPRGHSFHNAGSLQLLRQINN